MAKTWPLYAAALVLSVGLGAVLTGCSEDLGPAGPTRPSGSGDAPAIPPDGPGAPDIADVADGFAYPPAGERHEPLVVPLICGQGVEVGTVSVTNDEKRLYVTFTLSNGWWLGHSRLALATSLEEFPRPLRLRARDMVFQRFHDRITTYTYSVALRDGWLAEQQQLFVAGTAMLVKPGPRWRPMAVRFAWADGEPFPRGGWQAYFTYSVQSSGPGTCALAVDFPNVGVMFCTGQYAEILWTEDGEACGSEVRVELLLEGEVCQTLAASAPNNGVFAWENVEQCGGETSGYTVRVTDLSSGASDSSDEVFMIAECPED